MQFSDDQRAEKSWYCLLKCLAYSDPNSLASIDLYIINHSTTRLIHVIQLARACQKHFVKASPFFRDNTYHKFTPYTSMPRTPHTPYYIPPLCTSTGYLSPTDAAERPGPVNRRNPADNVCIGSPSASKYPDASHLRYLR